MRIDRAEVLVSCPGRNYVTLRLWSDTGLFGLGDATLNGRELAVASYLQDHLVPLLLGRDANQIEDTWQYLYRGAYWRRGPVTMSAIAAVDVALWDLKAKALGVPLYQLLGGASREGVLVYAHAAGLTPEETAEDVQKRQAEGYLAVRAQCLVPGSSGSYGAASGGQAFDPTHPSQPEEGRFATDVYLRFAPRLLDHIRSAVGDELHLLHDAHHRLTPIEAARLGRDLEPIRLFWLEDPVEAELQESYRVIRQHTTTPLAVGEVFNSIWDAHQLIREQLIDYIRTSILRGGGITHLRKIAALAELHHVRMGFHGFNDLSPVTMAAALHFDLWVPNFGIQEHRGHPVEAAEVFHSSYRFENGYMHPGNEPGIGVTYDDRAAAQFEYRPAYLPIVRRMDGTIFNW